MESLATNWISDRSRDGCPRDADGKSNIRKRMELFRKIYSKLLPEHYSMPAAYQTK